MNVIEKARLWAFRIIRWVMYCAAIILFVLVTTTFIVGVGNTGTARWWTAYGLVTLFWAAFEFLGTLAEKVLESDKENK